MGVGIRELCDDEWSNLCRVARLEGLDVTDYVVVRGTDGHAYTVSDHGEHDLTQTTLGPAEARCRHCREPIIWITTNTVGRVDGYWSHVDHAGEATTPEHQADPETQETP